MDCSKCGRHFDNAVFADPDMHECPGSAPVFVSDVLSAPLAQEPEPTEAAQELYAYNWGTNESQRLEDSSASGALINPTIDSGKVSYYSAYGQARLNEILMIGRDTRERMPVLLIGGTGSGKSHMIRDAAGMLTLAYKESNAYPNMDISLWFGMHRPVERDGFIGLEWQNGLLTEAALNGEVFFMEEATRAPQDAMGRMFGPTDTGSMRYLTLPEKGDLGAAIHKDFWLIATANPATAGYAVQRMDKAFNSRFLIIEITEPVADEVRILDDLIGQHKHREKFWRVVLDCRNHPESYINTRDIIMAARCLGLGFDPMRAIEVAIAHKYDDFKEPIMRAADLHFNGKAPAQEETNG